MNGDSYRSKLVEALVVLIAIAVVARVVSDVLRPLLPGLVGLIVAGGLLVAFLRRR